MTNLFRLLVASCVAVAAPAFAETAKPVHTHHQAAKTKAAAPQSPTDLLNAQSLQAAHAGQSFTPAASK
jgi:uncharacterized membrane-anchored protein